MRTPGRTVCATLSRTIACTNSYIGRLPPTGTNNRASINSSTAAGSSSVAAVAAVEHPQVQPLPADRHQLRHMAAPSRDSVVNRAASTSRTLSGTASTPRSSTVHRPPTSATRPDDTRCCHISPR